MPRPSRNLDQALLAAGRALLPHRGCAGLSIREIADTAGVNLGMFHYHFKTREAFLRALLQSTYEDMFGQLAQRAGLAGAADGREIRAIEALRAALRFLGRFLRTNRPLLARVIADALCGDALAIEFLAKNMPRHLALLRSVIAAAQAEGSIRPMAPAQALGFCAGALSTPILFGGAMIDSGALGKAASAALATNLLSDAAIDQRVELALAALSGPPRAAAAAARAKKT